MKLMCIGLILLLTEIPRGMTFQQSDYILVFERMEVISADARYMDVKIKTFKYNRTQAVINMTLEFKMDLGNALEVRVQGNRFASNEYRLFPMVFDRNVCDSLKKDEFGLQNIYKCGTGPHCPMKKGKYTICNWFPDDSKFPPYIPTGSYMVEFKFDYLSTEILFIKFYATVKHEIQRK